MPPENMFPGLFKLSINIPVHGLLTPVVSLPQVKVIVLVLRGLPIDFQNRSKERQTDTCRCTCAKIDFVFVIKVFLLFARADFSLHSRRQHLAETKEYERAHSAVLHLKTA